MLTPKLPGKGLTRREMTLQTTYLIWKTRENSQSVKKNGKDSFSQNFLRKAVETLKSKRKAKCQEAQISSPSMRICNPSPQIPLD